MCMCVCWYVWFLEEIWPCRWCSFAGPWHLCCCPNTGYASARLWCPIGPSFSEPSALLVKNTSFFPCSSRFHPLLRGRDSFRGVWVHDVLVCVAESLPGVWWFTFPLSLMTGGLCYRLRLDAIAACRPCECLVEVVSYRAGVDQRV